MLGGSCADAAEGAAARTASAARWRKERFIAGSSSSLRELQVVERQQAGRLARDDHLRDRLQVERRVLLRVGAQRDADRLQQRLAAGEGVAVADRDRREGARVDGDRLAV